MSDYRVIGKSIQRKDALQKVTGSAVYGADVNLPRMLYAAVCRSPHASAHILNVDISEAQKVPGVKVIATGKDNIGLFGSYIIDQPILAFDKVRYEGEPVAAVSAEDMDAAVEAVRLIKVEYEPLIPVQGIEQAIRPDAPLLHEKWSDYKMASAVNPIDRSNICDHFHLEKGDVEAGFKEADIIVENDYEGKGVVHATIESHAAIALYDEAGLTIWSPAQSPFAIRSQMSKLFHLSLNQVRFIVTQIGGGFGCKWELKNEPVAALLASKLHGRPVKLVSTRNEEFLTGGCRNPWRIHVKTGAKKDGTLIAEQYTVYWDTGAYSTAGHRINYNACNSAVTPYRIPNICIDGYTVVTNKHIATAYRGFGVPEVAWGYESQMNLLAEKLNMDPVELRLKNALVDGDENGHGEVMKACGVKDCIREAAAKLDWDENFKPGLGPDGKLHGRGISAFCKLTGTPSATSVIIKINEDGTVVVYVSGTEMGQGATTVIPQIVSESLGISIDKITTVPVDTLYSPYDKTTTSSRLTFHSGNAALEAVKKIKDQIIDLAAFSWKMDRIQIIIENGIIIGKDKNGNEKQISMDDIGNSNLMKEQKPVIAEGQYTSLGVFDPLDPKTSQSKRPTVMWFWGAAAAEVEVDPETGKVEVTKYSPAHDIGMAINPSTVKQQIEGGYVMGLGHALLEEMIFDDQSKMLNGNMVDFKMPTMMDSKVDMRISLIENHPHPEGPYGAKGIGEPAMCPTESAIAFAVSNAVGSTFRSLPVKADEVLMVLKNNQNK